MIKYKNECVDCGLPCIYDACCYFRVPHFICDDCNEEDDLYEFDGEQLCLRCVKKRLEKVNI